MSAQVNCLVPVVHINSDESNDDVALHVREGLAHQATQLRQLLHIGLVQVQQPSKSTA